MLLYVNMYYLILFVIEICHYYFYLKDDNLFNKSLEFLID
jgi:hypothetical protein